jgi:hypothetical protein
MNKVPGYFPLLILILLFQGNCLFSQEADDTDSLKMIEKVYLHIDRETYFSGDDIWFRAYLIDAFSGLLTGHSTNLHVELISPERGVISSRIVKLTGGLGNGDFHMPEELKSGFYTVRAYTNYMRNFDEEAFFLRVIRIINPEDSLKNNSAPVKYSVLRPEMIFFPEGGSLVDGVESVVAFKVLDANGKGCNVTGKIFLSSGEKVASFKGSHGGMGTFSLKPVAGSEYYALIEFNENETARYVLPASFSEGVVLNVSKNQDHELQLTFKTNRGSFTHFGERDMFLDVSVRGILYKTFSFRMSSLNSYLNIDAVDLPEGICTLTLRGITGLPVCERLVYIHNYEDVKINIDPGSKNYRQRDSVSVTISMTDSSWRECDTFLSLSAADRLFSGNTAGANSNIASWFLLESDVRGPIEAPSEYFDLSNQTRLKDLDLLLLTQGWRDFKWKYDKMKFLPEHGFTLSGRVRKKFLDTPVKNCWVNIGIFRGGNPLVKMARVDSEGRFLLEGLEITGSAKVIASVTGDDDKLKGWLQIDSLKYPSAEIDVNTISGQRMVFSNVPDIAGTDSIKEIRRFVQYAEIRSTMNRQYKLADTITPGEVVITARKDDTYESARSRSRRYLMGTPDKEIVMTPELKAYGNVYQLIKNRYMSRKTLPVFGLNFGMSNPVYMIDGFRVSVDDVKSIPITWVERVDIIDNPTATLIRSVVQVNDSTSAMSDGVVSIILKSNAEYDNLPDFHSVNLSVSGFAEPRVFYSPSHDLPLEKDYKPDLRTTLYWAPDILLKNGKEQKLKFYNSDNSGRVRIVAEGITSNGIPVSATAEYEVQ